jgi:hypothetical protein
MTDVNGFIQSCKNEQWRYVRVKVKPINKTTAELSALYADYPGSGAGQAALYRICQLADDFNVKLVLTPDPDSDQEKLERLYDMYGFVSLNSYTMTREPGIFMDLE